MGNISKESGYPAQSIPINNILDYFNVTTARAASLHTRARIRGNNIAAIAYRSIYTRAQHRHPLNSIVRRPAAGSL